MTIYADAETRKTWRINYGIIRLESAKEAFYFWERRGGPPSGCVLALAHAIEQIDSDEELLRQALEALEGAAERVDQPTRTHPWDAWKRLEPAIAALKERLK